MRDDNASAGDVSRQNSPEPESQSGRPKVPFEPKTALAERLCSLFPAPNWEEIARRIHQEGARTSGQSVRRYFHGDPDEDGSRPPLDFILAVCRLTGCRADWLLFGDEPVFRRMPDRAAELAAQYGYAGLPVRETAYKCWRCRGRVERAAQVCPHCAAMFTWQEFRERCEDAARAS